MTSAAPMIPALHGETAFEFCARLLAERGLVLVCANDGVLIESPPGFKPKAIVRKSRR